MIEAMCAPLAERVPGSVKREGQPASLVQSTYTMVLAGGRGSRLKQLTDGCAKPAVPIAGRLKIIDFTLSNCINSGIRRVSVLTQYEAQSLNHHIQQCWGHLNETLGAHIEVVPSRSPNEADGYSGTANAIYQNLGLIRNANARFVLILSGDHVYKMDYSRLIADHVHLNADVTVACIEVPLTQASEFGVMRVTDNGRIQAFDEKPATPTPMPGRPDAALASMGIYVFNADFLEQELRRDAANPASCHDFGKDIIPAIISHGRVFAHDFSESCVHMRSTQPYWRDVGTLDAFWEANMDFARALPEVSLDADSWPVHSLRHPLPTSNFLFDVQGHTGTTTESLVSNGCIVHGASVQRSVLFTGARVGNGCVVEDSLLLPHVDLGRQTVVRRAIIDSGCVLPDGIWIGVDPEHDRLRFTVSEKGVTLVTPAMLQHLPCPA
jgi:glucose-1-phosphate adenylyltransferase